jgi:hypothetical protein
MNDHHFSYPVVTPLQGATISGHAAAAPAPLPQPPVRHAVTTAASLAA